MVLNSIQKQPWIHSVMSYIYLSIFTIIGISLVSISFSFWMTAQTDSDAHAINLSGSMRMQTFHIGLAATHSPTEVRSLVTRLDHTWNDPLFKPNLQTTAFSDSNSIPFIFQQAYRHWFDVVRPYLLADTKNPELLFELLIKQVELTDKLVDLLQYRAESKIQQLRTFQLIDLLITILIGGLIFYLLRNRVDIPLSRLTAAAKNIRDGQVQQHIDLHGKDELALLAESFNQMSLSISDTYQLLERRVELRTKELQQSNMILEYSFNVAKKVLENQDKEFDYSDIILELSKILMIDDIELLLVAAQDDEPENCHGEMDTLAEFPVIHLNKRYGALIVKLPAGTSLESWQEKLTRSTANQIAIAISLQETKRQENRLAMLNERTVIARELHDSLAQSLSYLKIQVTRLQKSHDHQKYELQQPIIDELREGLSSAYRHLRELLTTFRLKIDETGLKGAIDQAITQLKSRSDMQISLDYRLSNVPLSPTEEIHLLQILREASQNAINHSKGTHLDINLFQLKNNEIKLIIQDNGVGLSSHPEKLNHYGLAIIQERSRHLHAELKVKSALDGVRIELSFIPAYLDKNAS